MNEACIFFEEALKFNNSSRSINMAIYELIKIKISQRDYYAAYHTATRMEFFGVKDVYLLNYKFFLEGVILIMKKKFEDALEILMKYSKDFHSIDNFLVPLYSKFIAYAFFKIGKHSECVFAYKKLKSHEMDEVSKYNLLLAEGIVGVEAK